MNKGNAIILTQNLQKAENLKNRLSYHDPTFKEVRCLREKDLKAPEDCEYIFSTWGMPVIEESEISEFFPKLKVIFYAGGTIRQFAEPYLKKGIRIVTAAAVNGVSVAEFTIGQILLANKGYFTVSRRGNFLNLFKPNKFKARRELSKLHSGNFRATIGIVGIGNIGSKVAEYAGNYDFKLIGYDPYISKDKFKELNVEPVSLETLFRESDVVTCHLPNIETTKGMIGESLLTLMKPYATFINTGRGIQIKEDELCKVMKRRKDLTALLDVTIDTPPKWFSRLSLTDNIILSPHIAGSFNGEVLRMIDYIYESYLQYIRGEEPGGEMTLDQIPLHT